MVGDAALLLVLGGGMGRWEGPVLPGWLGCRALTLTPVGERVAVRVGLGFRRPTHAQAAVLAPLFTLALRRCGLAGPPPHPAGADRPARGLRVGEQGRPALRRDHPHQRAPPCRSRPHQRQPLTTDTNLGMITGPELNPTPTRSLHTDEPVVPSSWRATARDE